MHTIAAISTPAGTGGIAVVRVSGNDALSLVNRLFRGKHALREARGYSVHYGELRSGEEVFLDDMTVTGLSETLGVPVVPVDNGGDALFRALIKAG